MFVKNKNMKEQLEFIPLLQAYDFDSDVEEELAINEINTHYNADILYIDWEDDEYLPLTKRWLIETYGEETKKFDTFAINPT